MPRPGVPGKGDLGVTVGAGWGHLGRGLGSPWVDFGWVLWSLGGFGQVLGSLGGAFGVTVGGLGGLGQVLGSFEWGFGSLWQVLGSLFDGVLCRYWGNWAGFWIISGGLSGSLLVGGVWGHFG